ncbi:3262_t:CDS:2 [Gigaspora rosea]|nr:3262_t:CDS:2 [Gigaspora rosea]
MNCLSNELEEVKNIVNELTKTLNDVTKRLNLQRSIEPHRCFTCQEVGHISRNCPNKPQEKGKSSKAKESEWTTKRTNVQFFEFVNNQKHQPVRKVVKENKAIIEDCLRIEIDLGHEAFNRKNG